MVVAGSGEVIGCRTSSPLDPPCRSACDYIEELRCSMNQLDEDELLQALKEPCSEIFTTAEALVADAEAVDSEDDGDE